MVAEEQQKIMIITGGSRGIGARTARLAAQRGYDVCINYHRDEAAAEQVAGEVRATGQRALVVRGDVASEAEVLQLFETTDRELGRLSVLLNNAGIVGPSQRVDEMDAARIQRMLAINVAGSFYCAREAVRRMSTRHGGQGGSIVNMSSRAAVLGSPNEYIDYAASKAAIDTLTLGLSKEVAAEGIRVNAVRPGLIYTDIHASGGKPDRVNEMRGGVPMQRGGTAEEVAEAVLWLASDACHYCTGSFIEVSGGR